MTEANHDGSCDICGDCWHDFHPDEEPTVALQRDAVRCCYCAAYTRTGLVEVDKPYDVPRHTEDPAWLERAGMRAAIPTEESK